MTAPAKDPAFVFYRSSDINLPVSCCSEEILMFLVQTPSHEGLCHFLQFKAKVSLLTGCIPAYRHAHTTSEQTALSVRPSDLSVVCSLSADGEILGLPSRTRPKEADIDGCEWHEWLQYYIKVLVDQLS